MATYTSFDDWSAWMQTVIRENGVGAITGPVMQEVLSELSDTADYLVSESGAVPMPVLWPPRAMRWAPRGVCP